MGLLPFTSTSSAACLVEERAICEGIAAAARAAPDHVVHGRSAPIEVRLPICARDKLDGRALDKIYEGVDIRLRAENMSHGG